MEKHDLNTQAAISSLIGLLILNGVMLGALFSEVPPNPPGKFGPYIGTTLALAGVTLPLVYWRNRVGYLCSIILAMMCMVSMGPHKLLLGGAANLLYPTIVLGSILSLTLSISAIMAWKRKIREIKDLK